MITFVRPEVLGHLIHLKTVSRSGQFVFYLFLDAIKRRRNILIDS